MQKQKDASKPRRRVLYIALTPELDEQLETVRTAIVPHPSRSDLGREVLVRGLPSFPTPRVTL